MQGSALKKTGRDATNASNYLCDNVSVLSVHLSDGAQVSDDTEHLIHLPGGHKH